MGLDRRSSAVEGPLFSAEVTSTLPLIRSKGHPSMTFQVVRRFSDSSARSARIFHTSTNFCQVLLRSFTDTHNVSGATLEYFP
jgi:hypothetical protein